MLQTLPDIFTIVILGRWNVHIFTPQWVADRVFGNAQVQVEVNLGDVPTTFRYTSARVRLIPTPARLIIGVTATDDQALLQAETVSSKVTELLPQTPVFGYGINFGFGEDQPTDQLLALFNFRDSSALKSHGAKLVGADIKRVLEIDDRVLNLTLSCAARRVKIDFNFHHDVTSAEQITRSLSGSTLKCLGMAKSLLESVYGLTLGVDS